MENVYRYRRKRTRQSRAHRSLTVRTRIRGLFTLAILAGDPVRRRRRRLRCARLPSYAHDLKPPEQAIAETTIGTSLAYDRQRPHEALRIRRRAGRPEGPEAAARDIAVPDRRHRRHRGRQLLRQPGRQLPRPRASRRGRTSRRSAPASSAGSGGSSITQQLVKNVYINCTTECERTAERKIKETVIALELKQDTTTTRSSSGTSTRSTTGISPTARRRPRKRYFGKRSMDLTLAEAALLAGLPQAPG